MQNILHFSKRWHHPVTSLKRTVILIIAILTVESLILFVRKNDPGFSPVYLLTIIRIADLLILLRWGPMIYQRANMRSAWIDSLGITLFLVTIGVLSLAIWVMGP